MVIPMMRESARPQFDVKPSRKLDSNPQGMNTLMNDIQATNVPTQAARVYVDPN